MAAAICSRVSKAVLSRSISSQKRALRSLSWRSSSMTRDTSAFLCWVKVASSMSRHLGGVAGQEVAHLVLQGVGAGHRGLHDEHQARGVENGKGVGEHHVAELLLGSQGIEEGRTRGSVP